MEEPKKIEITFENIEFILFKDKLTVFGKTSVLSNKTFEKIDLPKGTTLDYDVENVFKELGLNYTDYNGYSFGFNKGVQVEGILDESVIKSSKKPFTELPLFAFSDSEGNDLDITPITDWAKTVKTGETTSSSSSSSDGKSETDAIVTVVYDYSKHKLRAQADDGIHGKKWCQFPNSLRTREGVQYIVPVLVYDYDRDFYRIKGTPRPKY